MFIIKFINGNFYVLRTGCAGRLLLHNCLAWSTMYHSFRTVVTKGSGKYRQ
ncbi:MAG: transposase [Chloroflexi bacterium]|nr:MAG: transposase [Chloroflexota bacterium]